MKRCNVCEQDKAPEEFNRRAKSPDGRSYTCKACGSARDHGLYLGHTEKVKRQAIDWRRRNPAKAKRIVWKSKLKRVYGLTEDDYEAMWERQSGRCGLCGKPMVRHGRTRAKACVDHDHVSGVVRGLLCGQCNGVLGHVEMWPAGALAAWL